MPVSEMIVEALKVAGLSMGSVFAVLGLFYISIKVMSRIFK